jgi:hypothetical protein
VVLDESQSRICCRRRRPAAARPSSAFVTKSGISFSGYWFGPYVFEPRVIDALTPNVRDARGLEVAAGLRALYGLDGLQRSVSPRSRRRRGRRRPRPSRPGRAGAGARALLEQHLRAENSVRTKSVAPRIERSTCVSAAKLTIASQPPRRRDGIGVADVADDELDPRRRGSPGCRVGELVEHATSSPAASEALGEVGADEAGPACDEHAHAEQAT